MIGSLLDRGKNEMATKYIKESTIRALLKEQGKEVSPSGINSIDEAIGTYIHNLIEKIDATKGRVTSDVIMFILSQKNEQIFDDTEL